MSTPDFSTGPRSDRSAAELTTTRCYEIQVRGHPGPRWATWFDGLDLSTEDDGTTVLCGPVVDQAALHGLLQTLRDAAIPLISITELPPTTPTPEPTALDREGD